MGAVSKDEPLAKSSSLVASVVVARNCQQLYRVIEIMNSQSSAVSISVFSGLSCWIVASSFAWMRSARAFSTGAKTRARSLVWFTFLLLARALLAIVTWGVSRCWWL